MLILHSKFFIMLRNIFCQLNPPNWTTGFKNILEAYNGPLVIFVKYQKHEYYNNTITTHSRWCHNTSSNTLYRIVPLTWHEEYTIKEGLSGKKYFACSIEGNLFSVSGNVPDIKINLVELFGNTLVQANENKNLVMIGVYWFLMQKIGNHIQMLKNDILEKFKQNRNVAYLRGSKMDMYVRKRFDNISEMVFQGKEFIFELAI